MILKLKENLKLIKTKSCTNCSRASRCCSFIITELKFSNPNLFFRKPNSFTLEFAHKVINKFMLIIFSRSKETYNFQRNFKLKENLNLTKTRLSINCSRASKFSINTVTVSSLNLNSNPTLSFRKSSSFSLKFAYKISNKFILIIFSRRKKTYNYQRNFKLKGNLNLTKTRSRINCSNASNFFIDTVIVSSRNLNSLILFYPSESQVVFIKVCV